MGASSDTTSAVQSAEQFQAIFDSVQDAILVLDCEAGQFLDANRRAVELLGYPKSELVGMCLATISLGLSPYARAEAEELVRNAAQGKAIAQDWLIRDRSGRLLWIEANLLRTVIGGTDRVLLTARDISERKRSESEHSARLKRAESQNAVSLALAGAGPDYEAALELIVHYLAVQLGDLCVMHLFEEDQLVAVALSQSYLDGEALLPPLSDLPPVPLASSYLAQAVQAGAASLHDPSGSQALQALPEAFHPYCRHYRIHSLLTTPMRFQEKVIGTITLAKGGASRPYTFEDQAMLQGLADRTALTITNGRLYRLTLQQAEELRHINADLEKRVTERTAELAEANEQLRLMATTDGLTGLANRRHFDAVLEAELRRACREGKPLSLLLSDVDFFKRYNDCYGHVAGDSCLQAVGQVMRTVFRRASELPARYGGEEFAVILPAMERAQALRAAEKLRAAMEAKGLPHERSDAAGVVTLSIGVATCRPGPEARSSDLVAQADGALYVSKQTGRNRATFAEDC